MKKTEEIQLADGKSYTMSVLNIGDLIEIEKKFGSIKVDMAKTENIIFWVYLSLKKVHKDLTKEKLYELIDAPFIAAGKMNDMFIVLSRLNGWDKYSKNVISPAEKK